MEREITASPCVLHREEICMGRELSGQERRRGDGSFAKAQTSWAASGHFHLKSTSKKESSVFFCLQSLLGSWSRNAICLNYLKASIERGPLGRA